MIWRVISQDIIHLAEGLLLSIFNARWKKYFRGLSMNNMSIFVLGKHHSDHLALRQNTAAANIASMSVPGYRVQNVPEFDSYLRALPQRMRSMDLNTPEGARMSRSQFGARSDLPQSLSGNNFTLEDEMSKAGNIRREFSINTTLLKSFHRMYLSSIKN